MFSPSQIVADSFGNLAPPLSFGCVTVFLRVTAQGRKIFEAWQHPDKTWIGRIAPGEANDSQEKNFDFLGMDFSHQGLCGLSAATAERVKEVTAQVYDRTARDARQGKTKSPGQVAAPLASQAEFLRRVETYRTHWQRYLKGILAGFHHHLGAAAAQELYQRLCAQHRQLSSTDHWLNHFPPVTLAGKIRHKNT